MKLYEVKQRSMVIRESTVKVWAETETQAVVAAKVEVDSPGGYLYQSTTDVLSVSPPRVVEITDEETKLLWAAPMTEEVTP